MKVLTITTQYINNMGALLQCYALSTFLNKLDDIDCEVIQYFPKGWKETWNIFSKPKCFRDILKMIFEFLNIKGFLIRRIRNKKTRAFINSHIKLTKEQYYSVSSIENNPPIADAYVCGSDQIWNLKLFQDLTYFLSFTKNINCRRVAYAPSIAQDWTSTEAKSLKKYIDKFDALSIREFGNIDNVKSITDKPVKVVIDPVFLLPKEHWSKLIEKQPLKEPYILCYFLSVTSTAVKLVDKVRKLTGLKVVYLNHNALDKLGCDEEIRDFDPLDFIFYISNATIVCTNSFHCSAFSIIFERSFFFVSGLRNKRIETLQEVFHLGNRLVYDDVIDMMTEADIKIDYAKGRAEGRFYINESINYLLNSLYNNQHTSE